MSGVLKRKRDDHAPPSRAASGSVAQRKGEVEDKLVHGKKGLKKALNTAKGFEWQKLCKRIGFATEKGEDVSRLERELKVLKVSSVILDLIAMMKLIVLLGYESRGYRRCTLP